MTFLSLSLTFTLPSFQITKVPVAWHPGPREPGQEGKLSSVQLEVALFGADHQHGFEDHPGKLEGFPPQLVPTRRGFLPRPGPEVPGLGRWGLALAASVPARFWSRCGWLSSLRNKDPESLAADPRGKVSGLTCRNQRQ